MSYIQSHILKTHSHEDYQKLLPFDWKLILLTAHLVRLDDQYSYFERNRLQQTFKNFFTPDQQIVALESIEKVSSKNVDWKALSEEMNANTTLSDREYLVEFLFEMACADGKMTDEELDFIHQTSELFELNETKFFTLLSTYRLYNRTFRDQELKRINAAILDHRVHELEHARSILSVSEGARLEEIKKAYRSLMKQYHPDNNLHLNVNQKAIFKKKILQINEAYEILLNHLKSNSK